MANQEQETQGNQNMLSKHDQNCKDTDKKAYFKRMYYEELGQDFGDYVMKVESNEAKQQKEIKLLEKHKAEVNDKPSNLSLKHAREDGFLNKNLRSLTVAAMLRCIYGALEYAPTMKLKLEAIKNIKKPETFRLITQLCETCDWDETCNIGAKYLRVMRHVIRLSLD